MGDIKVEDGMALFPTPLSAEQEATFVDSYTAFLQSLAALNLRLTTTERNCLQGSTIPLDLSSELARDAIVRDDTVTFVASGPISIARFRLITSLDCAPWFRIEDLAHAIDGRNAVVTLPGTYSGKPPLRQILEFEARVQDEGELMYRLRIAV